MNHQSARLPDSKFDMELNLTAPICKLSPRHYAITMSQPSLGPEPIAGWSDKKLLAEWINTDPTAGDARANALAAEMKNRGWTAHEPFFSVLRTKVRSFGQAAYRHFRRLS